MFSIEETIKSFRVTPGKRVKLKDHDPAWCGDGDIPKAKRKKFAEEILTQDLTALTAAQELLYASDTWSILIIFQAMDAAGKDGVIKHVMSGINPQGCQVASFKHPSATELEHDFLWRTAQALPERGNIGIFNRSHYEEVVVVRVHPGLLRAEGLPDASQRNGDVWKARYRSIVG